MSVIFYIIIVISDCNVWRCTAVIVVVIVELFCCYYLIAYICKRFCCHLDVFMVSQFYSMLF